MGNAIHVSRQADAFSPGGIGDGWRRISDSAPSQEYPAGVGLFKQGSPPRDVYLIEASLIKLSHVEENGKELVVGLRTPKLIVGAAALILNKKHGFSAETLTGCQLRRLPASVFLNLLQTDAEFAWRFQQVQSYELYDQLSQMVGFGCHSARQRLEEMFSQLICTLGSKAGEKKIRLQLPLKHWELAELIAVTPEHLCRLLKEMQLEGLVQMDKGWIHISDAGLLRSRLTHD